MASSLYFVLGPHAIKPTAWPFVQTVDPLFRELCDRARKPSFKSFLQLPEPIFTASMIIFLTRLRYPEIGRIIFLTWLRYPEIGGGELPAFRSIAGAWEI